VSVERSRRAPRRGFDRRRGRTYDELRRNVFEKLKQLFGGGAVQPRKASGRPRPAPGGARRPARARVKGSKGGSAAEARPPGQLVEPAVPAATPREIPCPNCGEAMLSGWGTTCGRCRPNLVAPKTLYMAPGLVASASASQAAEGMTLGWLVIVSSIDTQRRGALVELDHGRSILSRADSMSSGTPGLIEFADTFMSSGHAVLSRPRSGNRTDAFAISDRETAPSANGTFVNSRRMLAGESLRLADGDVIKVGATEMVFRSLWLPGLGARAP
jgi:hypothetical protein